MVAASLRAIERSNSRESDPDQELRDEEVEDEDHHRRIVEHVTSELPDSMAADDHQNTYAVRDELWRTVDVMPPRMRTAFVLRYFEDLSEAEVAAVMGCAVGSVKSQISRGLARLRADLRIEGSVR